MPFLILKFSLHTHLRNKIFKLLLEYMLTNKYAALILMIISNM